MPGTITIAKITEDDIEQLQEIASTLKRIEIYKILGDNISLFEKEINPESLENKENPNRDLPHPVYTTELLAKLELCVKNPEKRKWVDRLAERLGILPLYDIKKAEFRDTVRNKQ